MLGTNAFKLYKTYSDKQRAAFLQAIAVKIEAAEDELIQTSCKGTGLPAATIIGKRGRTIGKAIYDTVARRSEAITTFCN